MFYVEWSNFNRPTFKSGHGWVITWDSYMILYGFRTRDPYKRPSGQICMDVTLPFPGSNDLGTVTQMSLVSDFILEHHCDVIMSAIASQITSLTIVYSTVYSGDQGIHQSSASLAFVRGTHRWPVNSPHKGPACNAKKASIWWRHHALETCRSDSDIFNIVKWTLHLIKWTRWRNWHIETRTKWPTFCRRH